MRPTLAANSLDAFAHDTWSHKVRFVGAGTIGVSAIWTLAKLVKPVVAGLSSAMRASQARKAGQGALLPRTEQDIPIGIVGLVSVLCVLPMGFVYANMANTTGLGDHVVFLVTSAVLYIAIMSFLVSAVCGYMAGLIGSSNSPLSGIGILAVIGFALIMVFGLPAGASAETGRSLVAYALLVTAVVFAAAAIANNNLQDLKTGQLVDATPWKQQVALVVGVVAGSAIIPPILDLLNKAYGFAGAPGPHHEHPLPAPQAGLISALAQGVIQNNVDWSLIKTGIAHRRGADLRGPRAAAREARRAPVAAGGGPGHVPADAEHAHGGGGRGRRLPVRQQRRAPLAPEAVKQLGVLLASGMIVGEGLVGVLVAALVAFSGSDYPMSIVSDGFAAGPAVWLGGAVFAVVIYYMYRRMARTLSA